MAISQNQKLRKLAAKAAKRKTVVTEKLAKDRRELAISKPRHVDLAASPIVDCLLSDGSQTQGMGGVLLSRKLTLGRFGVATFLVDCWCLGVKDAYFRVVDSEDYDMFIGMQQEKIDMSPVEPGRALKLVRDAAAYGAANGFPPLEDLTELERLFGDATPSGEDFVFGDGGRPHFVVGPYDAPRFINAVQDRLDAKFGPDGYYLTYPLEEGEPLEDDEAEPGPA